MTLTVCLLCMSYDSADCLLPSSQGRGPLGHSAIAPSSISSNPYPHCNYVFVCLMPVSLCFPSGSSSVLFVFLDE